MGFIALWNISYAGPNDLPAANQVSGEFDAVAT